MGCNEDIASEGRTEVQKPRSCFEEITCLWKGIWLVPLSPEERLTNSGCYWEMAQNAHIRITLMNKLVELVNWLIQKD
jgi:hypothetical protein